MAHYARIENNVVSEVIVVNNEIIIDENGVEKTELGEQFCQNLFGGKWKQTSYNGSFRGMFAGIGYTYDEASDTFIAPVEKFVSE